MDEKRLELLKRALYGHLSTKGEDGYPYTIGVHFVYYGDCFYFHCGKNGEKLRNIETDDRVCFTVDELHYIKNENLEQPCQGSARYESVVARGFAEILTDEEEKLRALREIAKKYSPDVADREMPQRAIDATNVIKITVESITYKEHG